MWAREEKWGRKGSEGEEGWRSGWETVCSSACDGVEGLQVYTEGDGKEKTSVTGCYESERRGRKSKGDTSSRVTGRETMRKTALWWETMEGKEWHGREVDKWGEVERNVKNGKERNGNKEVKEVRWKGKEDETNKKRQRIPGKKTKDKTEDGKCWIKKWKRGMKWKEEEATEVRKQMDKIGKKKREKGEKTNGVKMGMRRWRNKTARNRRKRQQRKTKRKRKTRESKERNAR